ncbi:hypothetical protein SAMN07250955_104303 [Arboricoccus pini]|uniref:Uncharacterized protein n=1 Tax=Arboricoccus pini TaxID=1963835 RepID=A0A212R0U7_9PROT|nr:hypothetical protein [Arboricoccus pini]SNB65582.1 hypothetical protein SAMN07250955_104303 [Arboricoccus pini]
MTDEAEIAQADERRERGRHFDAYEADDDFDGKNRTLARPAAHRQRGLLKSEKRHGTRKEPSGAHDNAQAAIGLNTEQPYQLDEISPEHLIHNKKFEWRGTPDEDEYYVNAIAL